MNEEELCIRLAVFMVAALFKNKIIRVRSDGQFYITHDDIYEHTDFACGYPLLLDKLFDELEVCGVELVEKAEKNQ